METFLFLLAVASLGIAAIGFLMLEFGHRRIHVLAELPPSDVDPLPRVSVVIAARNEERNLEEALASVLALDYPALEVIAVDDRSTDRTGEILDRLARGEERLKVLHVRELPEGWLGKNHAHARGAQWATGELLLFTDADVVFEPTSLRRAVGYLRKKGRDHLALTPDVVLSGPALGMMVLTFTIFFSFFLRPWKATDPRSSSFVGIGAFNLVRTEVYRSLGGHRQIRLRPDDDIKLGKLIKRAGFRQELLSGRGLIRVEWYASLRELIAGLMKNAFAGVEYRIEAIVGTTVSQLAVIIWPFAAVFLTSGGIRFLNVAVVGLIFAIAWRSAGFLPTRRLYALGFPAMTLVFNYILWRAMLLTLWQRGIRWRETFYSLDELKRNRV